MQLWQAQKGKLSGFRDRERAATNGLAFSPSNSIDRCRCHCLLVVLLCVASLADCDCRLRISLHSCVSLCPPPIHLCLCVCARTSACLPACLPACLSVFLSLCFPCLSVGINVTRQSITQSVSICLTHPLKPFQDRRRRMRVRHIPCACPYEKRSLFDPVAIQALTRYSISPS